MSPNIRLSLPLSWSCHLGRFWNIDQRQSAQFCNLNRQWYVTAERQSVKPVSEPPAGEGQEWREEQIVFSCYQLWGFLSPALVSDLYLVDVGSGTGEKEKKVIIKLRSSSDKVYVINESLCWPSQGQFMQSMNIHKDTLILSSGVAGDRLKHMKPLGSTRKKSMKRLKIL